MATSKDRNPPFCGIPAPVGVVVSQGARIPYSPHGPGGRLSRKRGGTMTISEAGQGLPRAIEADDDPIETREWLELDRRRRALSRSGARALPVAEAGNLAARPGRLGASAALFGLSQHDPARKAGRLPRRSRDRAAPHLDHSLERARHGHARQSRLWRTRRPSRELRLRGGNLRDRLQPLLPRRGRRLRGRPRLFPAAFRARRLRARLP